MFFYEMEDGNIFIEEDGPGTGQGPGPVGLASVLDFPGKAHETGAL